MPAMITRHDVKVIQRLASQGISQLEISRRTGISRDTIRTVINGRHPLSHISESNEDSHLRHVNRPVERCPGCGRLIEMPCRACQAKAYRDVGTAPNLDAAPPEGVQ